MKRFFGLAVFCAVLTLIFGCSQDDTSGYSESSDYDVVASDSVSESYVSGSSIKVSPSTLYLTVNGAVGGKTLYLAKTNPTEKVISASKDRYVSAASSNLTFYEAKSQTFSKPSRALEYDAQDVEAAQKRRCGMLRYAKEFSGFSGARSRSATAGSDIDRTANPLPLTVGTTTKSLWLDTKDEEYNQVNVVLRAATEHCNVWVYGSSYTSGSTASGKKITSALAEQLAESFEKIYMLERNLYGAESDKMFYYTSSDNWVLKDMGVLSDTGTKVNLVVYDIGGDYTKGKNNGSVLGYFSWKDYFPNAADINTVLGESFANALNYDYYCSNEGKYLYIDSAFFVEEPAEVIATVVHEYQHLITFGAKTIPYFEKKNEIEYFDVWLAELLAMQCEDFMHEYLLTAAEDYSIDNCAMARLPGFNYAYYLSGVEYNDSNVTVSYAVNYAFGAWLARKYGGAPLAQALTQSLLFSYDAIKDATGQGMEALLSQFSYDCVVSGSDNAFMNTVALQADDELYYSDFETGISYGYGLDSIDLWNLAEMGITAYSDSEYADLAYAGPYLFASNTYCSGGVRPYGMELQKIGTIAEGAESVTLEFNSRSSSSLRTYVIID